MITEEIWTPIESFPDYSVSSEGRIRSDRFDRMLSLNQTENGVVWVGMMRGGVQYHRSVPRLVAKAFIPSPNEVYDTPINLNGDRRDNRVINLMWRPRWFAVKYNKQFEDPLSPRIAAPIVDLSTGEISPNSFECAVRHGLLESDLAESIWNHTFVFPTYKQFQVAHI